MSICKTFTLLISESTALEWLSKTGQLVIFIIFTKLKLTQSQLWRLWVPSSFIYLLWSREILIPYPNTMGNVNSHLHLQMIKSMSIFMRMHVFPSVLIWLMMSHCVTLMPSHPRSGQVPLPRERPRAGHRGWPPEPRINHAPGGGCGGQGGLRQFGWLPRARNCELKIHFFITYLKVFNLQRSSFQMMFILILNFYSLLAWATTCFTACSLLRFEN